MLGGASSSFFVPQSCCSSPWPQRKWSLDMEAVGVARKTNMYPEQQDVLPHHGRARKITAANIKTGSSNMLFFSCSVNTVKTLIPCDQATPIPFKISTFSTVNFRDTRAISIHFYSLGPGPALPKAHGLRRLPNASQGRSCIVCQAG